MPRPLRYAAMLSGSRGGMRLIYSADILRRAYPVAAVGMDKTNFQTVYMTGKLTPPREAVSPQASMIMKGA